MSRLTAFSSRDVENPSSNQVVKQLGTEQPYLSAAVNASGGSALQQKRRALGNVLNTSHQPRGQLFTTPRRLPLAATKQVSEQQQQPPSLPPIEKCPPPHVDTFDDILPASERLSLLANATGHAVPGMVSGTGGLFDEQDEQAKSHVFSDRQLDKRVKKMHDQWQQQQQKASGRVPALVRSETPKKPNGLDTMIENLLLECNSDDEW